jgi:hypothetical protein
MKKTIALLLASFAMASVAANDAPAEIDACYRMSTLLDPAQSEAVHAHELARLQLAASKGSRQANHLLGALYRMGPEHPAALLPRDLDLAKRHLGLAALDGELGAMAGLAEIELNRGDAMAAMVWAQAMMHYDREFEAFSDSTRRAYQADLLKRAFDALGSGDRDRKQQDIEEFLGGFLAKYGERIEAGLLEAPAADSGCKASYDHASWPLSLASNKRVRIALNRQSRSLSDPGHGLFHIAVQPDGTVGKVLVFDGLPGAAHAKALVGTVERLQFNAAPDAPSRTALLPMSLDDDSVRLRE